MLLNGDVYLGDGLYARIDGNWQVEIFAHNGITQLDTVYLDSGMLKALFSYAQEKGMV